MCLVAVLTVPEKVVKATHYRGKDCRYGGGSSGECQSCHFFAMLHDGISDRMECVIMFLLFQCSNEDRFSTQVQRAITSKRL